MIEGKAILLAKDAKCDLFFSENQGKVSLWRGYCNSTISIGTIVIFGEKFAKPRISVFARPRPIDFVFFERICKLFSLFNQMLPFNSICKETFFVLSKGIFILENRFCYDHFDLFEVAWLGLIAKINGTFDEQINIKILNLFEDFYLARFENTAKLRILEKKEIIQNHKFMLKKMISLLKRNL